ncbi:MAG: hypothetical protein LAO20_20550 [Acidobacteriia bacterium]|nr:hypothetical protein [Terriglobia bacterium]
MFNLKSFAWGRLAIVVFSLAVAGLLSGCAISGYQTVMNRVVVPGGATQSVHVECPAGKKVLGGGFSIETPDDMKVFSSDPSDGHGNLIDHGWDVMVHNTGTAGRQTTAVAICAQ